VAINEPERLVSGFLIVGALNDFWRPRNTVVVIDEIDAIRGLALSLSQAGVLPNSQSPAPKRAAGDLLYVGSLRLKP
jgi:hypothetical protein